MLNSFLCLSTIWDVYLCVLRKHPEEIPFLSLSLPNLSLSIPLALSNFYLAYAISATPISIGMIVDFEFSLALRTDHACSGSNHRKMSCPDDGATRHRSLPRVSHLLRPISSRHHHRTVPSCDVPWRTVARWKRLFRSHHHHGSSKRDECFYICPAVAGSIRWRSCAGVFAAAVAERVLPCPSWAVCCGQNAVSDRDDGGGYTERCRHECISTFGFVS